MQNANLDLRANLAALLIRADGSHREIRDLSVDRLNPDQQRVKLVEVERAELLVGLEGDRRDIKGLVTTAGVNYLAADFLSASSNRINAFQYHDSGTNNTAATIAQTALLAAAGSARVAGTGSNPVAGTYQSVATINYTSSITIVEFGLFSAASGGTMWDRRVFTGIAVNNGDSIQFTYSVVINAGGS